MLVMWRNMIECYTEIRINNVEFRNLIKSHKYEEYILNIINKSCEIFGGKTFKIVLSQSHGESDFVDNNGIKYDAKLLFTTKQGQLIGDKKNDISDWIKSMIEERGEFAKSIEESNVEETKLYKIIKARIESLEEDENGILFIPFPIVNDVEGSIFLQFATDFLQAIYDKIKEKKIIKRRRIYFIYPGMEPHVYVLRCGNGKREYIRSPELQDFITFSTDIDT